MTAFPAYENTWELAVPCLLRGAEISGVEKATTSTYDMIWDRLDQDTDYGKALSDMVRVYRFTISFLIIRCQVMARFHLIRTSAKDGADHKVPGYYGFVGQPKAVVKVMVEELLDNDRYVFPVNAKVRPLTFTRAISPPMMSTLVEEDHQEASVPCPSHQGPCA